MIFFIGAALEVEALAFVDRGLITRGNGLCGCSRRGNRVDATDAEQRHEKQQRGHDRIAPSGHQSLHASPFRAVVPRGDAAGDMRFT